MAAQRRRAAATRVSARTLPSRRAERRMSAVLLIAEADGDVGLGHLAELKIVASALRERGVAASRIAIGQPLGGDADVEWLSGYDAVVARIVGARPAVVAWSVRTTRWRSIWRDVEAASARHLW